MKVIVTGAQGFVGEPTCRALVALGHEVVAVMRRGSDTVLPGVHQIGLGDLTGQTSWIDVLGGADVVVHLAGRAHVMHDDAKTSAHLYHEANVGVLEGLATAAVAAGVKRLVFVSSIKVNGEATRGAPFTPEDTPAPEDDYGRSKAAAETRLKEIAGDRMEWVILRPPLMYGPRMRGNMARLFSLADRGCLVPFGSIRNRRDLLFVGSFAELIAAAVSHPKARNLILLARDGQSISTGDLYRAIASALGKPRRVVPFPPLLLEGIGRLAGREKEVRRLIGNLEIDDSATREQLGWSPTLSLPQAMAETAKWFRARKTFTP